MTSQYFYSGIVENRLDPLRTGRVQVRVHGVHNPDKTLLPTEDLPWAVTIQAATSAGISGVGDSPVGILPGTTVFVVFADGESKQIPVIIGTIAGIGKGSTNNQRGFGDPDGTYPLQNFEERSEIPALASVDEDNIDETPSSETVPVGRVDVFQTPTSSYQAEYPFNRVIRTESGHQLELDNTPNAERVRLAHRTGTEFEMQPDGDRVVRVVKDDYELVAGNDYLYVKGDTSITVEGNIQILCQSNAEVITNENLALKVGGDMCALVEGTLSIEGKNDVFLTSGGTLNLSGEQIQFNNDLIRPPGNLCPRLEITAIDEAFQNDEPVSDSVISDEEFNSLKDRSGVDDYTGEAGESDTTPANEEIEEVITDCDITEISSGTTLAGDWTIGDFTTGAVFPHALQDQVGLKQEEIVCNLKALVENCVIPIENEYGRGKVQINSAFRRGSGRSQHNRGQAYDLFLRGMFERGKTDIYDVAAWCRDNIAFDQMIIERANNFWLHLSFNTDGNRRQILTRLRPGKYVPGIVRIN